MDRKVPFGISIAKAVADRVENGAEYHESHRDYCGMGFFYEESKYIYGTVMDGFLSERVMTFNSKDEFINWLAIQSDDTLDGKEEGAFNHNNQRITRAKLGF